MDLRDASELIEARAGMDPNHVTESGKRSHEMLYAVYAALSHKSDAL